MKLEIPDFLIEMSKQMHEQDNRITAEPIWQVRCKRYLVTEQGYSEHHWELHSPDSEGRPIYSTSPGFDNQEAAEELLELEPDWCQEWIANEQDIYIGDHGDYKGIADAFKSCFDFEDCEDWPDDWTKIYLQETEAVIRTCLTEADANAFIARKQHDYPKLYTYVETMNFCPQMIELRNWLLSLTRES